MALDEFIASSACVNRALAPSKMACRIGGLTRRRLVRLLPGRARVTLCAHYLPARVRVRLESMAICKAEAINIGE